MAAGSRARRGAGELASLLRIVGLVVVAVLVVYIVLVLLDANFANAFASRVRDVANAVDLGFSDANGAHTLFRPADPKLRDTLNYGLAAVVWYAVTAIVVRLVRRIA